MGRIFAIGDPHLSRARPKPMDIFGDNWANHSERIFASCRELVGEDDLLIIAGDISWAMKLEEALPDLDDIAALPGKKLLLKGNHDYWWQSRAKIEQAVHSSISLLYCDSYIFDDVAIVGARGWDLPGAQGTDEGDAKLFRRELERLRLSLESLKGKSYRRILAALHYPPLLANAASTPVTELLERYGVAACVYGHLHGHGIAAGFQGLHNGIEYRLVSADSVEFVPALVQPGLI